MSHLNNTLFIYPLIIVLPLLASLVSGLIGRKIGDYGAQFITCTSLIISSILILYAFYEVGLNSNPQYLNLGSWISSEYLDVRWELSFDQLSVTLGLAVLWCSTLIHIYSIDYLSADPHIQRFFSYLSAFTAGMLLLTFGGNYFVMFVGWEAIGVVSYLLINFYFTRIQANKAAILAFTMNRTGDMLISVGFFALFALFGSLNYSTIFSLSPYVNNTSICIIAFLLLGGALAKSANIPLQSWLPGSMEAPTPVSALLHAATLVTAGIYLLVRSSPILEFAPTVLLVITLIGSTTAFYGATCGLLQNDLKRIIAMSTISQLGYMMMAIGISQYNVALFHTVNHAFFKALLFLCAGAVIHSFSDQQDIRKMGGLIKFLPFIYSVMLVGTVSLMALPFLTGFYSKDLILELAYGKYSFSGTYGYVLGSITAGITAFYSFRLISLVFLQGANGQKQSYLNAHESNLAVVIPLLILSIFSIIFGYFLSDLFVGVGSDFFGNSMFIHPNNLSLIEAEFLPVELIPGNNVLDGSDKLSSINSSIFSSACESSYFTIGVGTKELFIKLTPTILSILGAVLGLLMYNNTNNYRFLINLTDYNSTGKKLYSFFNSKYYFDVVYNNYIVSRGLHISYKISKEIDRGAIELLGPFGLSNVFSNTGKNISKLDTGIITTYALYITLSLFVLIYFCFFINPSFTETNGSIEILKFMLIILFSLFLLSNSFSNPK